jgi:MFS family permease
MQLYSIFFFALMIPISAAYADKFNPRRIMILASALIIVFGIFLSHIVEMSNHGVLISLSVGMLLMGFTYGPLGTMLSNLFPTYVRYTGSSLSFNLAGILGASFAPFVALWLATTYGFSFVGYYLAFLAFLSLLASYLSQD